MGKRQKGGKAASKASAQRPAGGPRTFQANRMELVGAMGRQERVIRPPRLMTWSREANSGR